MTEPTDKVTEDEAGEAFRRAIRDVSGSPTASDEEVSLVATEGLLAIPESDRHRVAMAIAGDVDGAAIAYSLYAAIRADDRVRGVRVEGGRVGERSAQDQGISEANLACPAEDAVQRPLSFRLASEGVDSWHIGFRRVAAGTWALAACLTIVFTLTYQMAPMDRGTGFNGEWQDYTNEMFEGLPNGIKPSPLSVDKSNVEITRIGAWVSGGALLILTPVVILVFRKTRSGGRVV